MANSFPPNILYKIAILLWLMWGSESYLFFFLQQKLFQFGFHSGVSKLIYTIFPRDLVDSVHRDFVIYNPSISHIKGDDIEEISVFSLRYKQENFKGTKHKIC